MLGATGALIGFGAVMTREQVAMIDAWNAGRIDEALRARAARPAARRRRLRQPGGRLPGAAQGVPAHPRRPRGGARPPAAAAARRRGAGAARRTCWPRSGCCRSRGRRSRPGRASSRRRTAGANFAVAVGAPRRRQRGAGGVRLGERTRGRPDRRRRRVGRRRRAAPGRGRVRGRLPRAGRLARPGRVPRRRARLGADDAQAVVDEPQRPRPRRATTRSTRPTPRSRR